MVETAAHLVDHVFPRLPVRQWVLSLPKLLRYFLRRDRRTVTAVLTIFLRVAKPFQPQRPLRATGRSCTTRALRGDSLRNTGPASPQSIPFAPLRLDPGAVAARFRCLMTKIEVV